jgi:hypothetical protein
MVRLVSILAGLTKGDGGHALELFNTKETTRRIPHWRNNCIGRLRVAVGHQSFPHVQQIDRFHRSDRHRRSLELFMTEAYKTDSHEHLE